jgi:predicted nucleic acid-binding protein
VLISSLAGRWASTLFAAVKQSQLQLIVSPPLLAELKDVASRPRMRKWWECTNRLKAELRTGFPGFPGTPGFIYGSGSFALTA